MSRNLFVGELEDDVMCDVLNICRNQFPDISGWQEPAAGEPGYDVAKSFEDTVHIVYDRERSHWVTVVIPQVLKGSATVFVYDSLQRTDGVSHNLTDSLQCKIAQMCNESGPTIHVVYPACQQQANGDKKSCGYFAIANALEFCPTKKIRFQFFQTKVFSQHLQAYLQKKKLTAFPKDRQSFKSPGKVSRKEVIQVYCECRMPQCYDIKAVECELCSEWFHFKCVGLKSSPGSWVCGRHSDHSD